MLYVSGREWVWGYLWRARGGLDDREKLNFWG